MLLLAAPFAAASLVKAPLDVQSVQAQGANTLTGPLVLFARDSPTASSNSPAKFEATASRIQVETYWRDLDIHPLQVHDDVQVSNESFLNATLNGTENFADYHLAILPSSPGSATMTLTSSCATMAASTENTVTVTSKVYKPAPDTRIDVPTSNAVTWQGCSGAPATKALDTLQVQGNILIAAWAWNMILVADDGQPPHAMPSGPSPSPSDPNGMLYSTGTITYDRQRYYYLEDAHLTMHLGTDTPYTAYLGPAHATSAYEFSFSHARGTLTDGTNMLDVDAGEVTAQGNLGLDLQGTGLSQPLRTALSGNADALRLDGNPVAWVQPATVVSHPAPLSILLAVAATLAVGLLAFAVAWPSLQRPHLPAGEEARTWRQRRAWGYWSLACRTAGQGSQHQRSLDELGALPALRSPLRNVKARIFIAQACRIHPAPLVFRVLRVKLLADAKRWRSAALQAEALHPLLPAGKERARNAVMCAEIYLHLDQVKAHQWLLTATEEDPFGAWNALAGHPDLQSLWNRDRAPPSFA
jgi:hypothetical protein